MNGFTLPTGHGAYRWYYVDVTAGDWTCVVIFMLGAVFSSRYPARKAQGLPSLERCAVNVALYRRGQRRAWVLSEYGGAALSQDGRRLDIGSSSLALAPDGHLEVSIRERTVRSRPVTLDASLWPGEAPALPQLELWDRGPHRWQPIAPRARAVLRLEGGDHQGLAYVDTNAGDVPLGLERTVWRWGRIHGPDRTQVIYQPEGAPGVCLTVPGPGTFQPLDGELALAPAPWWKLPFTSLPGVGQRPAMLEWTPFYARLESSAGGRHALFEVADFEAFQKPLYLWMAKWRTRVEAGSPLALEEARA